MITQLLSSQYAYDDDGRIVQIIGNGPGSPSAAYTYNNRTEKLNRLTKAVLEYTTIADLISIVHVAGKKPSLSKD